jgi:hypothetical protein
MKIFMLRSFLILNVVYLIIQNISSYEIAIVGGVFDYMEDYCLMTWECRLGKKWTGNVLRACQHSNLCH